MLFRPIILLLLFCGTLQAETCKWWFQRYGWQNFSLEHVEDCLKRGSPVEADVDGGEGPLHIAAEVNTDPEVLLRLIRAGAKINGVTEKGWTPLHSAARFNPNPEVLLTLLDAGADINARTKSGKSFIYWMERNTKLKETLGYLKLINLYDLAR